MTDQQSRLLAAALADRYAIERDLGSGGMATVYLAEDVKHARKVALKVLHPEFAAVVGPERFLREIRITARLSHPHILPLLDSGRGVVPAEQSGQGDREFLYYVMPHIEGQSLRDRMHNEIQLPLDDALQLTQQIASALDYAHRQGVIHRDIKPENILLHEGEAMVADFGIALAVQQAGGERLTETGLSIGTPEYMSPEQVAGERAIDARSDVYSLACVLYEMLAGQPPFTGATGQAVLARHITDPVPPITTVRSGLSPAVAAAITATLAKAPADRFASAKAFADALQTETTETEEQAKSIVVLPFENLSPDPENEYFADGLTEELITDLSQIRSLLVISRNSAMQLKGTKKDTRTIGHELRVRYVLEGTVRKAGNRLRITAQLIDAERDVHLWADKFTGTLDDVFELQESVSRSIVDALEVELSPEERQKIAEHAASGSVEAYDLYLLGRHHMNRLTKEGLRTAVDHFQRAVELQPDFAKAYAGLADSYMLLTQGSGEPPLENFPKARAATLKALEIDPLLEEAHTSLGGVYLFFDWDWEGAERELRRAIELNPNYGQAHHWLAIACFARGRHPEALQTIKRALALDPLSPYVNLNVGWLHYGARDYDGALAHMLSVIATHANSPGVRAMLGQVYMAKGMFDEAITELERALELGQGQFIMPLLMLGYTLARAGRIDDARKLLQQMEDMEQQEFVNPDYFAIIHIGLGEFEQAVDRIEQGLEARTDWPIWLPVDPMVDPIRTHPRFVALLDRIGLSELAVLQSGTPAQRPSEPSSALVTERSLAVLPLANLMGDPEQDYFVDGMTDALISNLAKAGSMRVIARASAMEYTGTEKPLPQIAQELHVETIVVGSVLRSSEHVKITVRLLEGATERQLWADSRERASDDILALQSEVARAIVDAIGAKVSLGARERLAPARPVNRQAYDLYLKGRQGHFTFTEEGLSKAIRYFTDAIQQDPAWAPAHAALADSYLYRCFNGEVPPSELLPRAKAAATQAVDLDETLGDGHAQLATISIISDYDWERAKTGFARAIELSPQSYSARVWQGIFYQLALGRHDDALAAAHFGLGLDPLNPAANLDLAWIEYLSRKYRDAIRHSKGALELEPNMPPMLWLLGTALVQDSAFDEAIAAHEKAVIVSQRNPTFLAGLAHGYASAGRRHEARELLTELDAVWAQGYVSPWFTAAAYVALNEHDKALLWIERAYEVRDPWLPLLRVEPMFDAIRADQRYHDLVRRMHFPE